MERPTKQIDLPVSNYKAKIVTYFTRGEQKIIDLASKEGSKTEYRGDQVVMSGFAIDSTERRQDQVLLQGVKELTDKTGKVLPLTKETFDSLVDRDFHTLLKPLEAAIFTDFVEGKKNKPDSK